MVKLYKKRANENITKPTTDAGSGVRQW